MSSCTVPCSQTSPPIAISNATIKPLLKIQSEKIQLNRSIDPSSLVITTHHLTQPKKTMSTSIVCKRRPASPARYPITKATTTTSVVVVEQPAKANTTTTTITSSTKAEATDPRGPRSASIPIPKSAHKNPRARLNEIHDLWVRRRLMQLNARGDTTTSANDQIDQPITTNQIDNQSTNDQTTNITHQDNRANPPTLLHPCKPTPLPPILQTSPASAPTTQTHSPDPPTQGPNPTTHYNGYVPLVYGAGRLATWVLAPTTTTTTTTATTGEERAPTVAAAVAGRGVSTEPAVKRPSELTTTTTPTPTASTTAQSLLTYLATAHDRAFPRFWAERKTVEGLVKPHPDAETDTEKVVEPEEGGADDDSGSETTNDRYLRVAVGSFEEEPERKRCLCVKEGFGGVGGIRCGRGCDLA